MRAWQLAAIAPLGPADQQRVLAEDGPEGRIALLLDLVEEAASVLAYRLAAG